jgi:hypothetical protein
MFGWLRKREKKIPVEQTEAYKLGRRAGDSMAADLDRFMRARFEPAFNGYLGVLRDRFETTFDSPDAPPIILARIEYKIFLENVDELRDKMSPEISAAMSGWLNIDEGVRADFQRLIEHTIETYRSDLKMAGLNLFLETVDRLKEADDRYRAANPEKSAQYPPDK